MPLNKETNLAHKINIRFSCLYFQPLLIPADLSNEDDITNIMDQTISHFGKLNILVSTV